LWFEGLEPGKHHLFCTEYCGTSHSEMITWAVAHTPADFEAWMKQASDPSDQPLAAYGEKLYSGVFACATCHSLDGTAGTGPSFQNLYGHERRFSDGSTAIADDNYVRQSVLEPMAKVREGFQPVMPTFQGKVQDDQLRALIAFIKLHSDKVDESVKQQLQSVTVGQSREGGGAVATERGEAAAPEADAEGELDPAGHADSAEEQE
jgi:cytochrome c oxidase subunit 2